MGAITESFSQLADWLLAEQRKNAAHRSSSLESELLVTRLLRPLLPAQVRIGPGSALDVRDRQVGPFAILGTIDSYPVLGDGPASVSPVDGIVFCLHARPAESANLSEFAEQCARLKRLERRADPVFCAAVAYGPLSPQEVKEFLQGKEGESVDAVLSLGHNLVVRNSQGWYGAPDAVPYVTETDAGAALKALAFLLLQISQSSLGQPFALASYQHL